MERTYCYKCGAKLTQQADRIWHCPGCDQTYYENPRPCSDVAIFNDKGEVLLSQRAFDPDKGKFDMPGGFIEYDESAEAGALREVEEELNIKANNITPPKYVLSYTTHYPWGKETYKLLVILFAVRTKGELKLDPQDDVAAVKWVKPDDINIAELGNPKLVDYIREAQKLVGE